METTTERYLAFVDILGFSNMVKTNSHAEVKEKLDKLLSVVQRLSEPKKRFVEEICPGAEIDCLTFSDSILIYTNSNTQNDFLLITIALSYLFHKSIEVDIPVKGCLSMGKMTIGPSTGRNLVFGKPLINAYKVEEELKYIGLVVHPSAQEHLKEVAEHNTELKEAYFNVKTPYSYGNVFDINLNWFGYHIHNKRNEHDEALYAPQDLANKIQSLRESASGSARLYYDNTLGVFSEIIDRINKMETTK